MTEQLNLRTGESLEARGPVKGKPEVARLRGRSGMREVDTTCVRRHVVAGAEMAGRKRWDWQFHRPFDNGAVVPTEPDRDAVQLIIEVHVKQFRSAAAPHRLISAARDDDAVRHAPQVLYIHLRAAGLV